ncbi:MAG: radical SAM family heme chaperone HemW [Gemmatimonadales bacterium]
MTPRHLYVHVPFCARRCSYCDFSIAVRRSPPVDEYLRALRSEIGSLSLARTPELETLYFGGGTPSRLGAHGMAASIDLVRESFSLASGAEVTMEANPEDVTEGAARVWKNSGINRVSLGMQSFDDSVLKWMHRTHTAAQSVEAVEAVRSAGIRNLSVDLIFALPRSLNRSWESDLARAIDLAPEHISLYGLTIESATPLARWQERGAMVPATEDTYAEEFMLADRIATVAGYEHYEVSNFALPGKKSRHNSAYWSGAEYLGIGPSAHSFDGETRRWNVRPYTEWVARLENGRDAIEGSERLTASNRDAEKLYLGLRTSAGLSASGSDLERVREWENAGWARVEDDVVHLTSEGWLRLDSLAAGLTGL